MKEIGITAITPTGKPIYKGTTYSGRPGFILEVAYTLADGRATPSAIRCERKKDLPRTLERERHAAAVGAMKATLDDQTGQFWGTRTSYLLGGNGLQPTASAF